MFFSFLHIHQEGYCHFENVTHGAQVEGYYNISQGNTSQLKQAIALYGPVTVLINTRPKSFKFYDSGVYLDKECGKCSWFPNLYNYGLIAQSVEHLKTSIPSHRQLILFIHRRRSRNRAQQYEGALLKGIQYNNYLHFVDDFAIPLDLRMSTLSDKCIWYQFKLVFKCICIFKIYQICLLHKALLQFTDQRLDHAALVVGYGTSENGEEYWLIKNSWSISWGRKGFMKIAMKGDICGVTQKAVVVKVKWRRFIMTVSFIDDVIHE